MAELPDYVPEAKAPEAKTPSACEALKNTFPTDKLNGIPELVSPLEGILCGILEQQEAHAEEATRTPPSATPKSTLPAFDESKALPPRS